MENIALTKAERETFINHYKVVGDKIYIYRPNGMDKVPLEYSVENINYLNKIMESQVLNPETKKEHKEKSEWDSGIGYSYLFAVMGFGLMDIMAIGLGAVIMALILVSEAIVLLGSIWGMSVYHDKHKKMVNDIEKHEEFLPVAPEINEAVKTNSVVLEGINKFTAAAFIAAVKEYSGININTIDSCSLKDLRRIQKNIAMYKKANEIQPEAQVSEAQVRVL